MKPFENESDALAIGTLNIENRLDRVSVYGAFDIMKDKRGLQAAIELEQLASKIVASLKAIADLPEQISQASPHETIEKDPFGIKAKE